MLSPGTPPTLQQPDLRGAVFLFLYQAISFLPVASAHSNSVSQFFQTLHNILQRSEDYDSNVAINSGGGNTYDVPENSEEASGASAILIMGFLLFFIVIYYDVFVSIYTSLNRVRQYTGKTRTAALRSILDIHTYDETARCLKSDPGLGKEIEENQITEGRFADPFYGATLSRTDTAATSTSDSSGRDDSIDPSKYEECSICLEDFEGDQLVVSTERCQHIFHAECIIEWLRRHDTCPCCRAPMVTAKEVAAAVAVRAREREEKQCQRRRLKRGRECVPQQDDGVV